MALALLLLLKGSGRVVALPFLYVMLVVMRHIAWADPIPAFWSDVCWPFSCRARHDRLETEFSEDAGAYPCSLVIGGFYLVDRNVKYTFLFSWLIALLIAHLQLRDSWLRGALGVKWLTWAGRRSYGCIWCTDL